MKRRGLGNADRVALDLVTVTATGAVVSAPCYIYSIEASLANTAVTGNLSIADTTAAADVAAEATKLSWTLGNGGNAAVCDRLQRNFFPPVFINRQLFWANSNGVNNVSVSIVYA